MTAVAPPDAPAGEAATAGMDARQRTDRAPRPSAWRRAGHLAFLVFFAAYLGFAIVVLALGVAAVVASNNLGFHDWLHEAAFTSGTWGRLADRVAKSSHHVETWWQLAIDYGFSLFNIALALVLVWLRRHERTARLLAIAMVGTAGIFNLQAHAVYERLDPTRLEELTHDAFHIVAALSYIAALLLFPDGRLVPRWRGWWSGSFVAAAALAVVSLVWLTRGNDRTVGLVIGFGVMTPVVGVGAQLYRYRRPSLAVERQQSRLLFWALSPSLLVGLFALVYALANNAGPEFEGRPGLLYLPVEVFRVFQPVFSIIPIALFMGILHYRLWDVDRLISRTLVYSVLAGFVSVVYVGVVVGFGAVVGGANTENLGLSIVATGIVALAFQPVKERVTRFANYLVYGKRATPYEVLSEFTQRVSETPGTDELVSRMARILAEGTAARRADVWLKVGNELRPAASWPADLECPNPLTITGREIPWIENVTAVAAVRHQGELFGALSVTKPPNESLTPTEESLLDDLARQAGLVLRNVQLTADLLSRLQELRASRQRLIAAQDEARRRLERNLHDGAQQQLVALKVQLALMEGMVGDLGPEAQVLGDMLGMVKGQLGDALEDLRDLARGIFPPLLAAEGLPSALAGQARKATVPVDVEAVGLGRYSQDVESAVYFCVLEALQNIQKYAEASHVVVHLEEEDGLLSFEVVDDGRGFDPATTPHGAGVQNMRDRVEALDGSLDILSSPGGGTRVVARVPVTRRT
ncbi:MAG TPA: sensor histidine kinase [Acidimicrobiales bacterium]